jgi:hypothetical protein
MHFAGLAKRPGLILRVSPQRFDNWAADEYLFFQSYPFSKLERCSLLGPAWLGTGNFAVPPLRHKEAK